MLTCTASHNRDFEHILHSAIDVWPIEQIDNFRRRHDDCDAHWLVAAGRMKQWTLKVLKSQLKIAREARCCYATGSDKHDAREVEEEATSCVVVGLFVKRR
jgi:hypothetical protein